MRIADWLIEAGKALVEFGDYLKMQDARLDALGARKEVPKDKGEYTDNVIDALIASRAESSDEDWLRPGGRRDQECVRYGITREQVAGILAAGTKRERKNGNGSSAVVTAPTAVAQPETLMSPVQKTGEKNVRNMFDPEDWGEYPLEKGGARDQIPRDVVRPAEEKDKQLVMLVHGLAQAQKQDWPMLRHKLCCVRRLTRQQVAAILAEHTKQQKFAAQAVHA